MANDVSDFVPPPGGWQPTDRVLAYRPGTGIPTEFGIQVSASALVAAGLPGTNLSPLLAAPTGAPNPVPLSALLAKRYDIEAWAPHADGVTDDAAIIMQAVAAVSAQGGGGLYFGPHEYAILSQDIDLTTHQNVILVGIPGMVGEMPPPSDYDNVPFCLKLHPSRTIKLGYSTGITGFYLKNTNLVTPQNIRDMINYLAMIADPTTGGTALTIVGDDTFAENLCFLGFNQAYSSNGFARMHGRNWVGDVWNGTRIVTCGDTGRITDVHWWPFIPGISPFLITDWNIDNVTDNGSGLCRVHVTTPHVLVTGDPINVDYVFGNWGANRRWTVTVINNQTFDLQGSSFAGPQSVPCTFASGASVAFVTDPVAAGNVAGGQVLTGSGMSAAAITASIAGTTLHVTNVASGTLAADMVLTGAGVAPNTVLVSQQTTAGGDVQTWTISPSSTVASTAMAANTYVKWRSRSPEGTIIGLSRPATVDGTGGVNLNFSNTPFAVPNPSVPPIAIVPTWERGTGTYLSHGGCIFGNVQDFGHNIGLFLDTGASAHVSNFGCDSFAVGTNPDTVGVYLKGLLSLGGLSLGFSTTFGTGILANLTNISTDAFPIVGFHFGDGNNPGAYSNNPAHNGAAAAILGGRVQFVGGAVPINPIYISDNINLVELLGTDPGLAGKDPFNRPGGLWFQTPGGNGSKNTYGSGIPFPGITQSSAPVSRYTVGLNTWVDLQPTGSGGVFVGPTPDGTTVGGNNRGIGSFDGQTSRTAADQVAGGAFGFLFGQNNKIGTSQFWCGAAGENITIDDGDWNFGFGFGHQLEGKLVFARGNRCRDYGEYGVELFASTIFALPGDCQTRRRMLRGIATGGNPVRLTSDALAATKYVPATSWANSIPLQTAANYTFSGTIRADSGAANSKSWTFTAEVSTSGGVVTVNSFTLTAVSAGRGTAVGMTDPSLTADNSLQCLNITGTPPNSGNWDFQAEVIDRATVYTV